MSLTNYDKAALEAQLVRVRADYNALNMIQTSFNNLLLNSNEQINPKINVSKPKLKCVFKDAIKIAIKIKPLKSLLFDSFT